ncbi:heat shock factor-binding protein 1 [Cricetulus griseus]|nr:heat shock factor-binding protein 1 [Cricetulus griseus]
MENAGTAPYKEGGIGRGRHRRKKELEEEDTGRRRNLERKIQEEGGTRRGRYRRKEELEEEDTGRRRNRKRKTQEEGGTGRGRHRRKEELEEEDTGRGRNWKRKTQEEGGTGRGRHRKRGQLVQEDHTLMSLDSDSEMLPVTSICLRMGAELGCAPSCDHADTLSLLGNGISHRAALCQPCASPALSCGWQLALGMREMAETDPKTMQDITLVVETFLQQVQDKFQIMSEQMVGRIDDMSRRIDDMEKNIDGPVTQARVEELDAWKPRFLLRRRVEGQVVKAEFK